MGLATSFYNDRNDDIAETLVKTLLETHQVIPDFLEQHIPEGFTADGQGNVDLLHFDADSDNGDVEENIESGNTGGGGWGSTEPAPASAGWGASTEAPSAPAASGWGVEAPTPSAPTQPAPVSNNGWGASAPSQPAATSGWGAPAPTPAAPAASSNSGWGAASGGDTWGGGASSGSAW